MRKAGKMVFAASFAVYICVLFVLLFIKSRGYWTGMPLSDYVRVSSNIVPFKTIGAYTDAIRDGSMNIDIPIRNLIGNILAFLPMGIYLPFFFKKLNKGSRYLMFMTLLLVVVEVGQLVTRRGSFDVDDYILNILGALIGYGIWKGAVAPRLRKQRSGDRRLPM